MEKIFMKRLTGNLLVFAFLLSGCIEFSNNSSSKDTNTSKEAVSESVSTDRVYNFNALVRLDLIKILDQYPNAKSLIILNGDGSSGASMSASEARVMREVSLNPSKSGSFVVRVKMESGHIVSVRI
jgi:hypothetical protein